MGELFDSIQSFYQANTEIAIAIGVAIIVALIVKPKAAGKIVGAIAIILVVWYLVVAVFDLTESTMEKKSEAAHRTDREFQKSEEQGSD